MKVTDLKNPGKYGGSLQLRQQVLKAFHALTGIRARDIWPADAVTLKAFFLDCADKCDDFLAPSGDHAGEKPSEFFAPPDEGGGGT